MGVLGIGVSVASCGNGVARPCDTDASGSCAGQPRPHDLPITVSCLMSKTIHPPWSQAVVQAVCQVLASTEWPGLSNSEIDLLLHGQGIELLEDLG
jgi:hypothetical protein